MITKNIRSENLNHQDHAHQHVQGKSEYIDDRKPLVDEVQVGLFYSKYAKAKIESYDLSEALMVPGVLGIYNYKDFSHNLWGTIFQDQPLLAESEVHFAGEVIFIVAGETLSAVTDALKKIKVNYKKMKGILSIDEAIGQKSFIADKRTMSRGDFDGGFLNSKNKIDGQIVIKGADHFYLESQAAIAYPLEDGQIEVYSSTQHPSETQHVVAHSLGLALNEVVCVCPRMGGGFGGKESQAAPIAAYAALVAKKLNRSARLILTKDDDMVMTGKRNPFQNNYWVGFDDHGLIQALKVQLYSDGGAYADLSTSIMERAMLHCDNAYFIPNVLIEGRVCRTNCHPHTAFRGFGGPKGVATIEKIIEEIAACLGKDSLEIRKLNCYSDIQGRNTTHYNQKIENNLLPKLFSQLEVDCSYKARRKEIRSHNKEALVNKNLPLKGMSLTAVKFGISFTTRFLNQGNALVHLLKDGSIQISTGATEMGQGVNSRIAQIAADEFSVRRNQIRVMSTRTDKNANTSPTAASSGTDINGAAVLIACKRLKLRLGLLAEKVLQVDESLWAKKLAPINRVNELEVGDFEVEKLDEQLSRLKVTFLDGFVFLHNSNIKISFKDLINEAYLNRLSISEYAFFKFPLSGFDKVTGKGSAFLYYTQGVACSEVEISQITGELKVRKIDILMDLGRPINEGLDYGQVAGGFVQGMGWLTTENLYYNVEGLLLSHSPSTYKIPNIQDVPKHFKMSFLENHDNVINVRGSKAVGEPPLLLSLSVWCATLDALKLKKYNTLSIPATQEVILRHLYPDYFENTFS
jgi:xanthine dehydrogenase large subunit